MSNSPQCCEDSGVAEYLLESKNAAIKALNAAERAGAPKYVIAKLERICGLIEQTQHTTRWGRRRK
jgi:hypothetical protein